MPAINRLKNIVNKYDKTIFIEEALHRLVEIHYYLGLENEAKKYAKILGYNYNSSEWFEQSYKILNKDYKSYIVDKKGEKKDNKFRIISCGIASYRKGIQYLLKSFEAATADLRKFVLSSR